MADVQLVLQTTPAGVERLAVIKRARPELAQQAEYAAMFWEEARIAATLSHQNVVQTYEVGQDSDGYFLILEFLRGQSYAQVLTRAGYSDYRFSLEVLLGTLQGLEYAHHSKHLTGGELSLVHRDISPPNVFVTYDGQVKVLDFGIAKARGSLIQTEAGVIKGKAAYMAPEQMLGAPCDLRADLYAVGVMLWEATAGQQRFVNVPDAAISSSVTTQRAPVIPGAAARGLPELADEICRRALAYDPSQRYASAGEFHDQLAALAELVGGRLSSRAVGLYVSEHFAKERRDQQARIEAELKLPSLPADTGSVRTTKPTTDSRGLARVHARPVSGSAPRVAAAGAEAAVPESKTLEAARPAVSRKGQVLLVVALVVLAGLGVKVGASLSGAKDAATPTASAGVATGGVLAPSVPLPRANAEPLDANAVSPSSERPALPKKPAAAKPKAAPGGLDSKTVEAFGGRR